MPWFSEGTATRWCLCRGIPRSPAYRLRSLWSRGRLDAIIERTRHGGEEIVRFLKTGSAFYAPSAAIAEMVDAILLNKKRILPAAALLEGEYGIDGLFVGVPVKLGANGVEQVIEIELDDGEMSSLRHSADAVNDLVKTMAILEINMEKVYISDVTVRDWICRWSMGERPGIKRSRGRPKS